MKRLLLTFLLKLPLASCTAAASSPEASPNDDITSFGPRSAYRAIQEAFSMRGSNISALEEKFYQTYEPVFYHEPVLLLQFHKDIQELEQLRLDTPGLKEKHHSGFYGFNQYWLTHAPPVVKSLPWSWRKRVAVGTGTTAIATLVALLLHKYLYGNYFSHGLHLQAQRARYKADRLLAPLQDRIESTQQYYRDRRDAHIFAREAREYMRTQAVANDPEATGLQQQCEVACQQYKRAYPLLLGSKNQALAQSSRNSIEALKAAITSTRAAQSAQRANIHEKRVNNPPPSPAMQQAIPAKKPLRERLATIVYNYEAEAHLGTHAHETLDKHAIITKDLATLVRNIEGSCRVPQFEDRTQRLQSLLLTMNNNTRALSKEILAFKKDQEFLKEEITSLETKQALLTAQKATLQAVIVSEAETLRIHVRTLLEMPPSLYESTREKTAAVAVANIGEHLVPLLDALAALAQNITELTDRQSRETPERLKVMMSINISRGNIERTTREQTEITAKQSDLTMQNRKAQKELVWLEEKLQSSIATAKEVMSSVHQEVNGLQSRYFNPSPTS
ncbi:MAG: hypothetical protein PVJ92_00715 [Candidatus Dependentiae bacterium]|jgi:hypothetical protein